MKHKFRQYFGLNVHHQLGRMRTKYRNKLTRGAIEHLERIASNTLEELELSSMMSDEEARSISNDRKRMWRLQPRRRWMLYRLWLHQRRDFLESKLKAAEIKYEEVFHDYKIARQEADEEILKRATVIAMTTTGASRYQEVLKDVGPKIIIVEEAAEVLEAHILATLSPGCEHLILIGDHKQLEPKPAVYKLALKYNLSLSMFERMINNGLCFHSLNRQHRMRPEISQLVRPIYQKLVDNDNVQSYPHVDGVEADVFFYKHKNHEDFKEEGRSYSNPSEAKFVKRLCKYLIQQGYDRTQITILTPYSGQMFAIRDAMPREEFEGVRISILDNFQGEENDLIIISLVRSNQEGKIGFLDKENRVCVAFSRAKIGLYVVGDIDHICRYARKCTLWKNAVECLTEEGVGDTLPLYCQNHPDTKLRIKNAEDFDKAPEGGCERPCDYRLLCGHACRFICHPRDKEHEEYECKRQCTETCERGHKCRKQCHFSKPCNCPIPVEKELNCGHLMAIDCFIDPDELHEYIKQKDPKTHKYICKQSCQKVCKRGHSCVRRCHHPDACKCPVLVEKQLPCNHSATMKCFKSRKDYKCQVIVTRTLDKCSHNEDMECHEDPRLWLCKIVVTRTLPCEHVKDLECHVNTRTYRCQEMIEKELVCGHVVNILCCERYAVQKCKVLVTVQRKDCDHYCTHECSDKSYEILNKCKEIVEVKRVDCDHLYHVECNKKTSASRSSILSLAGYRRRQLELEVGACEEEVTKEWSCHHPPKVMECYKSRRAICKETCGRKCSRDHVCEKKCHFPQDCDCKVKVEKRLPKCGHIQDVPCSESPLLFKCATDVKKTIPACDHKKVMKCHVDPDSVTCEELVMKELGCGHEKEMECSTVPETMKCRELVTCFLTCGHEKRIECSVKYPFTGIKCTIVVPKTLNCGHIKHMECSCNTDRVSCKEKTTKKLDCGHKVEDTCYLPKSRLKCTKDVETRHPKCNHTVKLPCNIVTEMHGQKGARKKFVFPKCEKEIKVSWKCGHKGTVSCWNSKDAKCNRKCEQKLSCGHVCKGTCESCKDGNTHVKCQHKCNQRLFCGHKCSTLECGSSTLCKDACGWTCPHGKCSKPCHLPCDQCTEHCTWMCQHFSCSKLCSEECDRPRCNARCLKRIGCGHLCSGYCGEPCPLFCRECHKKTLQKLTKESIEKVAFVQLDCGDIFEGSVLDSYMDNHAAKGVTKSCPKCEKTIYCHPRYNNVLRQTRQKLNEAKWQCLYMMNLRQSNAFPLISQSVLKCKEYLKHFGMFLLLKEKTLKSIDLEMFVFIENLQEDNVRYIDSTTSLQQPILQRYLDIYGCVEKISVFWQLAVLLISCESADEMSSDEEYGENLVHQNAENFGMDYDVKTKEDVLKRASNGMNRPTGMTDKISKEMAKLKDSIEEEVLYTRNVKDGVLEKVNKAMDRLPLRKEMSPMMKQARSYPRLPFLIDLHQQHWAICKKGMYMLSCFTYL